MTVVELRAELKQRGLSQAGNKAALIERLVEYEKEKDMEMEKDKEPENQQPAAAPEQPDDDTTSNNGNNHVAQGPDQSLDAHHNANTESPSADAAAAAAATADSQPLKTVSEQLDRSNSADNNKPVDAELVPATEIISDAANRKRRSRSPPPPENESSRKRARAAEHNVKRSPERVEEPHNLDDGENYEYPQDRDRSQEQDRPPNSHNEPQVDYDRAVAPAQHPATSALYIKNFMRPLREPVLKDYLVELAALPGTSPDPSCIVSFYLDPIRTHSFVQFSTVAAASRVRSALHGTVWPNESNRKELWVDFIPEGKVDEWAAHEKEEGGRDPSCRWEVHYEPDHNGEVTARLVNAAMEHPRRNTRQPLGPPAVPTGPANNSSNPYVEGAPSGPRGRGRDRFRQGAPPSQLGASNAAGDRGGWRTTRADPPIQYRPVSEDVAQRRLANLRSHITKDRHRDLGRPDEINRYTFENSETFVDRGKEAFIGIRPPHRERERRRLGLDRRNRNRNRRAPSPRRSRDETYRGGENSRNDYERDYDRRDDFDRDRDSSRRDRRDVDDVPRSRFDGQPLPTYTGPTSRARRGGRRDRY